MTVERRRGERRSLPPTSTAISWGALREPRHALPAVAVVLCTLAPAFGFFVTATVLPSVVAEIGGLALYAWASTAYGVASILGSAGSSVAVRRAGTRGALMLASASLAAGTAACALAPTMPVLIAGRVVQGLGGGIMTAAVHGVVREVFPEALWPRMLATISAAWGLAAMSGPAVGGLLAGRGWWRGAFWIMVPLIATAAVATWRILPRAPAREATAARVPLGRLALICTGVLCVGSLANAGAPGTRAALAGGAVAAIALALRLDRAAAHRLFPAGMLSLRSRMGQGFWMILFVAMSTTPGSVYLPLLLQLLHETSATFAGYLYAAQSLAWTTAALVSARLVGPRARAALALGPLLTATGFVGLAWTIADGPLPAIVGGVILTGAGIGTCWAHVGSAVLGSAREGEGAATASLIPTTQTFAVALGSAVCGIVGNAAGLSGSATHAAATLAGEWLFGSFLLAPLLALAIASRLAAAGATARR